MGKASPTKDGGLITRRFEPRIITPDFNHKALFPMWLAKALYYPLMNKDNALKH
jgi:hypothetical protein